MSHVAKSKFTNTYTMYYFVSRLNPRVGSIARVGRTSHDLSYKSLIDDVRSRHTGAPGTSFGCWMRELDVKL